jgi:hypothetical protein
MLCSFIISLQECNVPPVLLRIAVRFGSIHPFCSELWRKWAAHREKPKHTIPDKTAEEDLFKPFHVDGMAQLA